MVLSICIETDSYLCQNAILVLHYNRIATDQRQAYHNRCTDVAL